jgi:AICAR transformylase/IMP cyclohydrolase PurH
VQYIAQPGGSLRDDDVTQAADEYDMVMAHTGLRIFLH